MSAKNSDGVSSNAVSEVETFMLSSRINGDLKKESTGRSSINAVQIKHPAYTPSTFHLSQGSLAARSPITAYDEQDQTPSSSGRSIAAANLSKVLGTWNSS